MVGELKTLEKTGSAEPPPNRAQTVVNNRDDGWLGIVGPGRACVISHGRQPVEGVVVASKPGTGDRFWNCRNDEWRRGGGYWTGPVSPLQGFVLIGVRVPPGLRPEQMTQAPPGQRGAYDLLDRRVGNIGKHEK